MNLDGVVNTQRTETYFWQVCGTISFIIIGITAAIAWRRQIFVRFNKMNPNDYMMEM